MNIARLDLNLLLVFDAIYQEGNITHAGARLGLSQPAVSAALARLRDLMGDPLFIRTNRGVVPTERAKQLAEPLEGALNAIRSLLQEQSSFDPIASQRCFRILMLDVGEMNLLPRLLQHLHEIGSHISIATTQITTDAQLELLERGSMDLAVGFWPSLTPARGFFKQLLFVDSFACLTRADHPSISNPVTLEELLRASHVVVSSHANSTGPLDRVLAQLGVNLKVAVRTPHYLAVPMILEQLNLAVVMPARPAAIFARNYGFRVVPLGFNLPTIDVCQYWHQRFARDPGLMWLTSTIHKLFADGSPIGPYSKF
jgi:DNA-binding transcriptional LysR family regulator